MKFFHLRILLFGALFGILLTKSQVISWFKIRDMFHFREPDLYLIIGSAVATAMLFLFLIRKFAIKDADGRVLAVPIKNPDRGKLLGGFIFGVGWFITGSCPGPIYAQIGTGEIMALVTLAGALLGAYAFSKVRPRLIKHSQGSSPGN
ncbi:MAG: DUF6691 family protein [Fibrobacteria bacterium]